MIKIGFYKFLKNRTLMMRFCQTKLTEYKTPIVEHKVKEPTVNSAEKIQVLEKKYLEFEKKIEEKYGKKEFGFFENMEANETSRMFKMVVSALSAALAIGSIYFYVYWTKEFVIFKN